MLYDLRLFFKSAGCSKFQTSCKIHANFKVFQTNLFSCFYMKHLATIFIGSMLLSCSPSRLLLVSVLLPHQYNIFKIHSYFLDLIFSLSIL